MEETNSAMHEAFKLLVLNRYTEGAKAWNDLGDDRKRIKRLVSQSVAANEFSLSVKLGHRKGDLDGALVPLGRRKDRGFLLYAEWDFTRSAGPETQIIICVVTGLDSDRSRLIAYRFEGPHNFDDTEEGKKHAFWHAQPTTRRIGKLILEDAAQKAIAWIPDDTPAIPVAASCPVSLLVAAIYSVLGAEPRLQKRVNEVARESGYANADRVQYAVPL